MQNLQNCIKTPEGYLIWKTGNRVYIGTNVAAIWDKQNNTLLMLRKSTWRATLVKKIPALENAKVNYSFAKNILQ
jgi:hypothetical protein